MWDLVVLFTAIIIATIPICEVKSRPVQDIDIATILNILNEHQHKNEYYPSPKHEYSLESKSSDDALDREDNSHYGSLKSRDISELIEQATLNTGVNDMSSNYKEIIKKNHAGHKNRGGKDVNYRINKLKSRAKASVDERTINQILSYFQNQVKPKEKPRKQALKNSNVVHAKLAHGGDKYDGAEKTDDYSKIYIIFNPLAIQKRTNKHSLSNLISSLPSASFPKERAEVKDDVQHKGFSIKDGVFSRRARRDSREKYDLQDSMEDYKQKRARNDHGSGRTAIPYIRHRGDIYERNN